MDELNTLYWDSSFEIVLALMELFPDVEIESVGLDQLYEAIIALPNFADDPALANESILLGILREWYEETQNG